MFQMLQDKLKKATMVLSFLFIVGLVSLMEMDVNAASSTMKFDFGNGNTVNGYTQVKAETGYDSYKGYGFNTPSRMKNVSASGTGILSDAVQFMASGMTSNNTFNVDLDTGLYEVKVYLGNTMRTSIAAEGVFHVINMMGDNATASFIVPVTDGQLNILATAGKDGYAFTLSAMEITKISSDPTMPPTIWLCGDSTVCDYYPLEASSQCGWGQLLKDYVDSSFYVKNLASSGQYAKGFVNSGQFSSVMKYIKPGDYYIISIGINDGNYSNEVEYYDTVTNMVRQVKAVGANVILVKQQGRATDVTQHPNLTGRWYGSSLDRIGNEQNVKVVDLFNLAFNYYKSIGQERTNALFLSDGLHPNREGAKVLASIVAQDVNFSTNTVAPTILPTSSIQAPLDGRTFMLKNAYSGLYMDVEGAKANNGTNVLQWGKNTPSNNNTWRAVATGNGYYNLYSCLGDGKTYLLDVDSAQSVNGTNIQIYQNTFHDAQAFEMQDNADGTYTILTKVSNGRSCVEVKSASTSNGANVQEWEVNGHECQKWFIEFIENGQRVTATPEPIKTPTPVPTLAPTPVLTKTPIVTILPTPTTIPTSTIAHKAITVKTDVNSWDNGFTANFTLENKSTASINGWCMKVKKSEFQIAGSWNVTVKDNGDFYLLTSVGWNATISPNSSISFGFTSNGKYVSSYYYEITYDGGEISSIDSTSMPTPTITIKPTSTISVKPTPVSKIPTIYIAGDSTVQTYRESYYPQQGWGAFLADHFNDVTVLNHAIAGRSSKNFVTQGRLDAILNTIQKGDYLLVQFAINDANYNNQDRYAPVNDGTYQSYIKQYVEGAINKGATPILVTTTLSLSSYSNVRFVNSYQEYCNAMKAIANEYCIPCIDLNSLMVEHLNAIGYNQAYYYYMISSSDQSNDQTHFTETGAKAVAALVANAINRLDISLAQYVK